MSEEKLKKIYRFTFVWLLLGLVTLIVSPSTVYGSGSDFAIETLNEDGQSNQQGFYQLEGSPGEQKEVKIRIYNYSDEEIKVNIEINQASTNKNGLPSYTKQIEYDESLLHRIDNLVEVESDLLTISAQSSKTLPVKIKFPNKKWEGDILGGIRFTKDMDKSSSTIIHEMAYTAGILLRDIEGDPIENDLHLKDVFVDQRNYRNFIEATIQNSNPVIISDLTVDAKIYKTGESKILYSQETSAMRMAPNSNFPYGISTGDSPLQAGNYTLKMKTVADGKEKLFEKEFTINSKEAKNLNKSAVNLEKSDNWMLYSIIGILICIVLILFILLKIRKMRGK